MTIKLGIAPIAWTNDDLPELGAENSFEQCISEMALARFTGTEIGNKYPKDPDVLKSYLAPRGLNVASAWFSVYLTTKSYEENVPAFIEHRDFLHAMGAKVIVISEQGHSIQGLDKPIYQDKPTFTEEEWDKLTTGLEKLGELAKEKEMTIVYHHHMGTGVQTTEEIDRLMAHTDPEKVSLLFDTGHLVFSGEDPLEIYKKHHSRIKHIHFKDIRKDRMAVVKESKMSFLDGVKSGVFTVPGDGMIDFSPIWKLIDENDYEGWIVVEAEQDPAKANPFLYAKKARNHIKQVTGL
ncbi:myo-inosose-2 dehydratase [Vagococcus intermedius]|uniref:Inosose dehydratase n=1 Tax=Vagococcus intermedius TaxID=2991418 RepID=A0AAF0CT24_9ENTE|nr:myo-inosose-2 dehydratase [Vagococcus intermedius]WEG72413.1 myo-inosose-2 dehydratase [Vagococcus intermedius]WEG74501.1 myo-inosose-2 dehydratase [Vagococcus intermedius]